MKTGTDLDQTVAADSGQMFQHGEGLLEQFGEGGQDLC